jgi:hypothetical protein
MLVLYVASFHTHHIHYYQSPTYHNPIKSVSEDVESICLFNQINTTTYFYYNSEGFELAQIFNSSYLTFFYQITNPQENNLHPNNLRAPPLS